MRWTPSGESGSRPCCTGSGNVPGLGCPRSLGHHLQIRGRRIPPRPNHLLSPSCHASSPPAPFSSKPFGKANCVEPLDGVGRVRITHPLCPLVGREIAVWALHHLALDGAGMNHSSPRESELGQVGTRYLDGGNLLAGYEGGRWRCAGCEGSMPQPARSSACALSITVVHNLFNFNDIYIILRMSPSLIRPLLAPPHSTGPCRTTLDAWARVRGSASEPESVKCPTVDGASVGD